MRSLPVLLLVSLIGVFAPGQGAAKPFVPGDDALVLERLPSRPGDPVARELRQLRGQLASQPHNLQLAARLAKRYFELAMGEGDPRYIGYAQAALTPWWDSPQPPVEALVLRATLRQYRHDFAGAQADLTQAISRDPGNASAWAWRAAVNMVQADYAAARRDCQALRRLVSELIAVACSSYADGVTGQARQGYSNLHEALEKHPGAGPDEKLWVLTRLAEMALRLGQTELAEKHFKEALALGITDGFLLAAYSDFLLDQNRPSEVVALLKDKTRSDILLLRLALAEKALNLPLASEHKEVMNARFAASRLRGDKVHLQEEARFTLYLLNQPREALAYARENWTAQREPRDARILLEAALAAKDPAAAQPALDWLGHTRHEDPALNRLAEQIRGLKP